MTNFFLKILITLSLLSASAFADNPTSGDITFDSSQFLDRQMEQMQQDLNRQAEERLQFQIDDVSGRAASKEV